MAETRTVTATWARTHFGEIIRNAIAGERFIVERDRIPAVVILSVAEYERLQRLAAWARFQDLSRQAGWEAEEEGLTEADLQAELETIKRQVFAERYGHG
nr:type II toxin-antitoxin system prevent-host-death family antitoxin [Ardenticatena sp.]